MFSKPANQKNVKIVYKQNCFCSNFLAKKRDCITSIGKKVRSTGERTHINHFGTPLGTLPRVEKVWDVRLHANVLVFVVLSKEPVSINAHWTI